MSGPLTGIRVIEIAGIGPGPFCAMLLSDMGAEVIRIDRKRANDAARFAVLNRGRRSLALDLKKPEARDIVLRLIAKADALQEGFRPGVMERLGLGPDDCLKRNPKLVYGRMTGWGQSGPMAAAAGHDINYIALSGALHGIGRAGEKPVPPLNLVGDFGGGGLYLAFGMVCAILEARGSGRGQVVDAAMIDGAAHLMSLFWGQLASGRWTTARGTNVLDGAAPFYDAYECADGKYVAVGAIEPQFHALLAEALGLKDWTTEMQMDRAAWPGQKAQVAAAFKTRTRAEWRALLEGTDACFAPILALDEVAAHPHNAQRDLIIEVDGLAQPAPAPRFSRTIPAKPTPPPLPGAHSRDILADFGWSESEIADLTDQGVI